MRTILKKRNTWPVALAAALLCLPLTVTRADEADDQQAGDEKRVEVTVTTGQKGANQELEIVELSLEAGEVKPGKYWIGVLCTPLEDDLLKTHLDLECGMVITEVLKDSPAEKAGLQVQDIMVQVAGKPLEDLKVLAANIEEAGAGEVNLTIIRKGHKQEVKITPAERPVQFRVRQVRPDAESAKEWKMLQEALRKQGAVPQEGSDEEGDRDLSLMLVMPGVILPDQAQNLPNNLEVTISKKGEEEAKITVKQGDKKWEVDAKSLDQLPDTIRPHIEKMLGHGHQMQFHFDAKGLDWLPAFPQDLKAPMILKKSLEIAPDKVYELHRFEQGLNKELREKIQQGLEEANRALEDAKTKIPAEALERVENELKVLREQIEQLRKEREEDEGEEDEG